MNARPVVLFALGVALATLTGGGAARAQVEPGVEPRPAERLEAATRSLLGRPYVLSPLGEGPGTAPDADPRLRLDAFDCTTFVETAIARALVEVHAEEASDEEALRRVLDRLRYDGAPAFERRRHLMTAQWLPGLEALNQLAEITHEVGGEKTEVAPYVLDERSWRERRVARSLELPAEVLPFGEHPLAYVPLEELSDGLLEVPSGTLLNVVRQPVPWSPVIISHQALLFELADGTRVVRHASASLGRVADQTPANFLRILRQERKRPVLGLSFWRVTLAPLPPHPGQREK